MGHLFQVPVNHLLHHFLKADLGFPTEFFPRLSRIAQQSIYLSGTQKALIQDHVLPPVQADVGKGDLTKFANSVRGSPWR